MRKRGEFTLGFRIKKANRKAIMKKAVKKENADEVKRIKEMEKKLRQMEKEMELMLVEKRILSAAVSLAEERGFLVRNKIEGK